MGKYHTEPKLYVTTSERLDDPEPRGEWFALADYADKDDFLGACLARYPGEEEHNLVFPDSEGIPESLYDQSGNLDEIYEYIDTINGGHCSQDVIDAGLYLGISLDSIGEAYQGEFRSDSEFAQIFAEDGGLTRDRMSWPHSCIDWEQAAKELMYDYSSDSGHYFSNY